MAEKGAGLSDWARGFCALAALVAAWLVLAAALAPARALEPITIGSDADVVDITLLGEQYEGRGDKLSIETAATADGIAGRMTVSAKTPGTNPNWIVFALSNPTDKPVRRYFMAQRYDIVGSKAFLPNLDSPRIANLTPSLGFRPDRVENESADIYLLNLEPGATITYIVELASADFPRLSLVAPATFGRKARDITLFNGILLGISGLLGIFLISIFAASHKGVFPAAALVASSVVAYLCVDFGFWHKLFQLSAEDNATYRAGAEAAFAASIVVFLYVFLNLRLWRSWVSFLFVGWFGCQLSLIVIALVDAKLAAGLARLSFLPIAAIGTFLIGFFALRGQERALSLLPTWMLFLVWLFGAAFAVNGQLSGEIVTLGLNAGIVLITVLLGFTVTQYGFQATEAGLTEDAGQFQLRVMALDASGASVWEWNTRRNEIIAGPDVDAALGYPPGTMRANIDDWLKYLHSSDRERLRLLLWMVRERNGGEINTDFRLRRSDGAYLWYELRAASLPARHSRSSLRCVGLLRDVTPQKRMQERLLHNAIHDSLTSLPNRELFLDRLLCAIRAVKDDGGKPTVLFIDIDTFRTANQHADLAVSDGVLLTMARRLSRHLGPVDTLARISTEQFAILLVSETDPRHIAMLAERVRRSLRSPIKVGGKDVILTGSIGISVFDGQQQEPEQLLREAETAMYRAKRSGADRIELFKPEMRGETDDRAQLRADLRQAAEKRQIRILYQPVIRLGDRELAGMQVVVRWDHPKYGRLSLGEFLPIAEDLGIVGEIGGYVLERSVRQAVRWQRTLSRPEPLFVSVNLSSRHFFRQDIIQELRLIIGRETAPKGCLMLEVNESLIMENPEQAIETLTLLGGLGASLCLDNFGASYSSLTYLHRLPFDMIKIDRQLLSQDSVDRAGAVVFKSIVSMARELDKDVIATNVEQEDEDAYVKAIGCDYAQGFYYGEPMSEKEVMTLVQAMSKTAGRNGAKQPRRLLEKLSSKPAEDAAPDKPAPAVAALEPPRRSTDPSVDARRERPAPPAAPMAVAPVAAAAEAPPSFADFELLAGSLDLPVLEDDAYPAEAAALPFAKRPART
ncbi:MAG: EAL domain-containing protein [Hyphomicrobiales bacterium]|nr:EAL domain-containing protein [Hyphomicrobiales bacterium]